MQDADESVAEGAKRLMVHVSSGAVLVVERPCAGAGQQRGEGPLVDGVIEAAVTDVTGQDSTLLTRGDGQW